MQQRRNSARESLMPFRLADKKTIYVGTRVRVEVHHLENEATHARMVREVIVHPGAVVILPLLSDDKVMLIQNRRYAIRQVLLELPAGTLGKDEDPMNAAGRELEEETGLLAGRMTAMPGFYSSPGVLTEKMFPFIARDLEKTKQALEEGEEIETYPVPLSEALAMCGDGRIIDGKTIATLLLYERFFSPESARHGPAR
jgi:ADP-ribose pyrophosphatase